MVAVGAWQSPFAGKIAAEGSVRVLFTDHDVLGDGVFGNNVMKKAFIDQHPQAVKDLVTASAKAVDWAAGHPDDARKLVAQFLQKHGENRRVRFIGLAMACRSTRYTRIATSNSGSTL